MAQVYDAARATSAARIGCTAVGAAMRAFDANWSGRYYSLGATVYNLGSALMVAACVETPSADGPRSDPDHPLLRSINA